MRRTPLPVVLTVVLTACVAPGSSDVEAGAEPGSDLVPTFAATSEDPDGTAAGPVDTPVGEEVPPNDETSESTDLPTPPAPASEHPTPAAPPTAAEPVTGPPVLRATVDDAVGDVTPSVETPPDHADLVRTEVIRDADGFTILHELGGGAPPDTDDEHTMNIATFFDIDGDGEIDYHVWANLSSSGWGSAYFDQRSGTARYADEDDVDVHVDGSGRVVVRFPQAHLSDADSFRWSVGSEWGRYEVIGTDAAARDSAPEDHGSVSFPQ